MSVWVGVSWRQFQFTIVSDLGITFQIQILVYIQPKQNLTIEDSYVEQLMSLNGASLFSYLQNWATLKESRLTINN